MRGFCIIMIKMFWLLSFFLLVLSVSAVRPVPGSVKEFIHMENNLSWYNANTYCLSNFRLPFDIWNKNELKNLSGSKNQLSWVGLSRIYSAWKLMDETNSTYFNWYGECPAMNSAGYWYITSCDAKLSFVCKMLSGGWVVVKESKTWLEAKQQCDTYYAGLAIVLHDADNKNISSLLDVGLFWIGLATVDLEMGWKQEACHIISVVQPLVLCSDGLEWILA